MSIFLILINGNYDEEFRFFLSNTLEYLVLYQVWWTEWIMFHCVTDFVIHSLLFPEINGVKCIFFSFSTTDTTIFLQEESTVHQCRFLNWAVEILSHTLSVFCSVPVTESNLLCFTALYPFRFSPKCFLQDDFPPMQLYFPISSSVQINFKIFLNYLVPATEVIPL